MVLTQKVSGIVGGCLARVPWSLIARLLGDGRLQKYGLARWYLELERANQLQLKDNFKVKADSKGKPIYTKGNWETIRGLPGGRVGQTERLASD